MKCVRPFGTGRQKRQADITLLFQYINLSLKIDFVLRNSADPDEMPISETLHLGLCC